MSVKAKWFAAAVAVVAFVAVGAAQATKVAAPAQTKAPAAKAETWAGKISDSGCNGGKHVVAWSTSSCRRPTGRDSWPLHQRPEARCISDCPA